jgi:hypothetical protein
MQYQFISCSCHMFIIGWLGSWLFMITLPNHRQLLCHTGKRALCRAPRLLKTTGWNSSLALASHKVSRKYSPTVCLERGRTGNTWWITQCLLPIHVQTVLWFPWWLINATAIKKQNIKTIWVVASWLGRAYLPRQFSLHTHLLVLSSRPQAALCMGSQESWVPKPIALIYTFLGVYLSCVP